MATQLDTVVDIRPSHRTDGKEALGLILWAWACVAVALGVLLWSTPRGLDLNDESFALMAYRYPSEYPGGVSSFSLLVNKLFNPATTTITTYRILAYIAAVVGAILLGLSFSRWLRTELARNGRQTHLWFIQPVFLTGWLVMGALVTFSISPRTLSYNGINTFLAMCSVAALLSAFRVAFSKQDTSPALGWAWLLLTGVPVGLQVFVKASTAAGLLVALGLVLLVAWQEKGWRAVFMAWAMLGIGVGLGLGIYFSTIQPVSLWWQLYQSDTKSLMAGQYSLASLFKIYLSSLFLNLRVLAYPWGPVFALLGWKFYLDVQEKPAVSDSRRNRWVSVGAGVAVAFILYHVLKRKWYLTAHLNHKQTLSVFAGLMVVVVLGAVISNYATKAHKSHHHTNNAKHTGELRRVWAVGGLLLALPLLMSVGTVNDLSVNILSDLAGWFAVVILVLAWFIPVREVTRWVSVLLCCILTYAAEQTLWGTLQAPYLLPGTMQAESQPITLPGLREPILVSRGALTMFTQTQELLTQGGFRPGDPIIAMYDTPGLVLAAGGISPKQPWFFKERATRNCDALTSSSLPLERAFLMVSAPVQNSMVACILNRTKHRFPNDYILLGIVAYPYADNAYGWYAKKRSIAIYKPR